MKFTITRAQALDAFSSAQTAADYRTLPVLGNLLLTAEEGTEILLATGTNLETEICSRITGIAIEQGGSVAVPARKLAEIVRLLPDQTPIRCELSGDRMIIKSCRSRFTLATIPACEFPDFERPEPQTSATIPSAWLQTALGRVRFAAGINDVRFYLNSVALQLDSGVLRTLASDGHRFALSELPIESDVQSNLILIPVKSADELTKLLRGNKGNAELSINSRSAFFELPAARFGTKLIDGRYPDYRQILPRENPLSFSVGVAELREAMRRALVLADEKFSGIQIEVCGESLSLKSSNCSGEKAMEEVAIANRSGEPRILGFNGRYLIDALGIAESEDINVEISSLGAALLTEPGNDRWSTIIMPMRL